ncbi:MAG: hypothetical protein IPG60_13405 [Bacteroidetes bacterium]|nr:hypothetical protein [Bacteroidota bacterium]
MKMLLLIFLIMFTAGSVLIAQNNSTNQFYEISYIQPKPNQSSALEYAIKAHYKLFHETNDVSTVSVRAVTEGDLAGWYVWMYGPCGNASINKHKSDGAHDADWNTNVEPYIKQYGDVSLWQYDPEFSKGNEEIPEGITYNVMAVDLKKGKEKEFKNIMKKVQQVEEQEEIPAYTNTMYWNLYNYGYEYDVKVIMPANDSDFTSSAFKNNYELVHGDGSYNQFMKDWKKIVMEYNTDVMSNIK